MCRSHVQSMFILVCYRNVYVSDLVEKFPGTGLFWTGSEMGF